MGPTNAPVKTDILDTATAAQVNDYVCLISQIRRTYHNYSGAPAGAEGARGRSTIAIEIGNPSSRENLDVTSVRPSVRPYARIRAGDEFVFVLDLESFSGKQ